MGNVVGVINQLSLEDIMQYYESNIVLISWYYFMHHTTKWEEPKEY